MSQARDAGRRLRAEFIPNTRNRMMYITYKFAGFVEVERQGDLVVLETDLGRIQQLPAYVALDAPVRLPANQLEQAHGDDLQP